MTDIFKLIEEHGLQLHGDIEHFAELVRADERQKIKEQFERRIHRQKNNYGKTMQKLLADEREACAKVCDEREKPNLYGVRECAKAIRARGGK